MRKLYKYLEGFGRMGTLYGLFVADSLDVDDVMDEEVYLGDVLGKHSDVTGTIDRVTLRCVSDDPDIVYFFDRALGGCVGINPVARLLEQREEDE